MCIQNKIWNNWISNIGNCKNCVDNDENNYWYPLYFGNKNATIFVLADTPAYNIEQLQYRRFKDYYKKNNISNNYDEINKKMIDERLSSNKNMLIKILKAMFLHSNYTLTDIYFSNIKKCGNHAYSTNSAYEICSKYVIDEINNVKSKFIITIGRNPLKYLSKMTNLNIGTSILNEHGNIYNVFNSKLLVLTHWGYFRRQNKLKEYCLDINKQFRKLIND